MTTFERGNIMHFLKSRGFIAAVCIISAVAVAFVWLPRRYRNMAATTYVISAAQIITEGTVITDNMLTSVEVGAYGLSENICTSKDEIVGKVANTTFFKGEYIIPQRLITEKEYNDRNKNPGIELNSDEMLIAIQLPSTAAGLAGMLRAGDEVSIYELVEPTSKEIDEAKMQEKDPPQSKAKKIFESLKVYEVRNSALQSVDDLDKALESANESGEAVSFDFSPVYVIFCCTEKQAEEMVRLVLEGTLYMTLEQEGVA